MKNYALLMLGLILIVSPATFSECSFNWTGAITSFEVYPLFACPGDLITINYATTGSGFTVLTYDGTNLLPFEAASNGSVTTIARATGNITLAKGDESRTELLNVITPGGEGIQYALTGECYGGGIVHRLTVQERFYSNRLRIGLITNFTGTQIRLEHLGLSTDIASGAQSDRFATQRMPGNWSGLRFDLGDRCRRGPIRTEPTIPIPAIAVTVQLLCN